MPSTRESIVMCQIGQWTLVEADQADVSFVDRQHRRRLSTTTQLALTAYHGCNPQSDPVPTVFASRYGEYTRTFGILKDIAAGEPTSPAAFSVSVHNTPSGIVGIATGNPAPSSTVAANGATVEAGFLEAALQHAECETEDVIYVFVDEPLPELYRQFRGSDDRAYAVGLRLTSQGTRTVQLSWKPQLEASRIESYGLPAGGRALVRLLDAGAGGSTIGDGRLCWEWRVDKR